jgi:hypothetical protein
MKLATGMLAHRASWCAAVALACSAAAIAGADEPKCATCPSAASASQEDVWLARLPMVGRLFKNAHVGPGPASCAEAFERIGIDFEFCPPPPGFAHVWQFSGLGCPCEDCICCPCAGKCGIANCTATHCGAAACTAANCNLAACSEGKCGCENCPASQAIQHVDHLISAAHPMRELTRLFEHIAELSADKAAAEAALEVREEAHEQFVELFESMAELVAENASLEAKLAAQIEHGKLAEKLVELASENARLKAQVELADQRHELLRGSLEVAVENERLKLRVAELEKHHATPTAVRVRGEKKPR